MSQHNVETVLVTCLTCDKTMNKIEIWYGQILLTGIQDTTNALNNQNELLYMQELPLTTPTKMYMGVCCNTDV